MVKYHIFSDGSSRGNPGPGGWAMVVMDPDESRIFYTEADFEDHVTNNRMELKAMLCALHYAESNPRDQFIVYSDSAYVVNSINSWMDNWAANGWRNSKKQIVENVDLMQALYACKRREFPNFEIKKCSGHTGAIGNELADAFCTKNTSKVEEIIEAWDIQLPECGDNWFPND